MFIYRKVINSGVAAGPLSCWIESSKVFLTFYLTNLRRLEQVMLETPANRTVAAPQSFAHLGHLFIFPLPLLESPSNLNVESSPEFCTFF